jgi:hypothetical protein
MVQVTFEINGTPIDLVIGQTYEFGFKIGGKRTYLTAEVCGLEGTTLSLRSAGGQVIVQHSVRTLENVWDVLH